MGAQLQPAHHRRPRRAGPRWRASTSRCSSSTASRARWCRGWRPRSEWREEQPRLRVTTRRGVLWSDGAPVLGARRGVHVRAAASASRRSTAAACGASSPACARWTTTRWTSASSACSSPASTRSPRSRSCPSTSGASVEDPVTFANEHPVATGPFTEVRVFQNQVYELGRNPALLAARAPPRRGAALPRVPGQRPRQPRAGVRRGGLGRQLRAGHRPRVRAARARRTTPTGSRSPAAPSSSTRTPARRRSTTSRVRKALSMAIDRDLLVDVALYRYTRPADATGLSDAYAAGATPRRSRAATGCATTWRAPTRCSTRRASAAAPDGLRRLPRRPAVAYEILAVSGWSDWVRAAQVIARGLRELGIDATVRTYDFSAWFQRVQKGEFDLTMGWSLRGPDALHLLPLAHVVARRSSRSAVVRPTGTASAARRRTRCSRAFETRGRPGRAAPAAAPRCSGVFVGRGAGHPALPQPVVGRVQHAPLHGLPHGGRPVRRSVPQQVRPRREPAGADRARAARRRRDDALPAPAARLLPGRGVGRAHAQLLPAAPHARATRPRRCSRASRASSRPRPCDALRETFGLTDAPLCKQYLTYLRPRAARRPRHLGRLLPRAGRAGDRHRAGLDAVPGRHARSSSASRIGTLLGVVAAWWRRGWAGHVAAARRSSSWARSPTSGWRWWRSTCSASRCGWFPLGHAYSRRPDARLDARLRRRRGAARRAARRPRSCSPRSAAGCCRCATR